DPGDPPSTLQWVDREGRLVGQLGSMDGNYWDFRLSPDGRQVVANPDRDLWVFEVASGLARRVAEAQPSLPAYNGVWSPDGRELVYVGQNYAPTRTAADGSGEKRTLTMEGGPFQILDWSSDGDRLLLATITREQADLWIYSFASGAATPWMATAYDEAAARFSPDVRWIAYTSNVTDRREIYIRPLRGAGSPLQVSTDGGVHPVWRRDGRELFYLTLDDRLMVVDTARLAESGHVGATRQLFHIVLNDISSDGVSPYDAAPDGQRFLINVPETPEPLTYIQNWPALLNARP
ncbi:MAG: hypothetical protein OEW19_21710, partial [Acidobacteriota bacterium]|nr:hypothetical protein [Acidobacteriota bacterium]